MGYLHSLCCSSHRFNMVPTLSTLRLPDTFNRITLAQLIVIVTLLPFSFQSKQKDNQLVIYSNGPCLVIRFFESELTPFPVLKPLEVPLKIAGKNCSQNDPGWITSIDHYMDPVTFDFHLIWADSDSSTLWTGRVNSTNYHINDVKQLRDNNSNLIGSRVRSLIFASGKLFISLPYSHRIEMYDLINGLSIAQQNSINSSPSLVNLNRTILLADNENIGKVLYNQEMDKLFWIEGNKCLWSGTPSYHGIVNKKLLLCANHQSDGLIYSSVIDTDSGDIYVFYEKGKIERLFGTNWSQRTMVIKNCLAEEKYKDAKFYTIKMIKEKQFLRFYASDTQHYAFRQISLIKRFLNGKDDDGNEDEYILDRQNSGILFTDAPNIYDFIFPEDKRYKSHQSMVISESDYRTLSPNTRRKHRPTIDPDPEDVDVTESYHKLNWTPDKNLVNKMPQNLNLEPVENGKFPPSVDSQSMMKPTIELINDDLPDSSPSSSKSIRKLDLSVNNLDTINPLSKIIVSSSTSSPSLIEPPQITLLTVTSSSTIIYWLYAFFSIGTVIAALWILVTLLGLRKNYQKVYSDDDSLKVNLTSVKY